MTNRKRMTREQRQHHYRQWRASGMNKNQYARHHGINTKTFGNLCRALADGQNAATMPSPALLPVDIAPAAAPPADNITLTLRRVSLNGSVPAVAALIRELNLC